MIFKNNSLTKGKFYRVDKNLNNGQLVKRKIIVTGNGSKGVTIPPILLDMIKSENIVIDWQPNKDGTLKEITIKPYFE